MIKGGRFEVFEHDHGKEILQHSIKQIHKCVMEQADHRCFLYTLRPPEKPLNDVAEDLATPLNSNSQNYQCHLYQAQNESQVLSIYILSIRNIFHYAYQNFLLKVKEFFSCLRQQPREVKLNDSDSLNSLADLSVHTESQFFEVSLNFVLNK